MELYDKDIPVFFRWFSCWAIQGNCYRFKWGEFVPEFGLGLWIASDDEERNGNLLEIHLLWGKFFLNIPKILRSRTERVYANWDVETIKRLGRDWYEKKTERQYGFSLFEGSVHIYYGVQPGQWISKDPKNSDHVKIISNPLKYTFVRRTFLYSNGKVFFHEPKGRTDWEQRESKLKEISETHDYHYLILPKGEVQNRKATIYGEEMEWRRIKWLPLFRKIRRTIEISFDDEVGERSGSWKGGTIGCSWEWLKGETMLQSLRRMERERRFR